MNERSNTRTTTCTTVPATRRARARRVRLTAAGIAVVGVAGCSGEDIAERVIENRIEAESGENIDIDLDSGNIRIETDEGTFEMSADGEGNISIRGEGTDGNISIDSDDGVTVIESDDGTAVIGGGAGVPDGFPGSVPLPDGFEPQFSQSVSTAEGDAWILGGEMDGTAAEIAESYLPSLEAAGFERLHMTESPDSVIFTYDNGEFSVNGLAGDDGDGGTYFNVTVADSQR
jgi:hypothetical protein